VKIALAQVNPILGDIKGNLRLIKQACEQAAQADVVVFSELVLCGYPIEDLALNEGFIEQCNIAIADLVNFSKELKQVIVVGAPLKENGATYNAALAISAGQVLAKACKQELPNYGVFDEKRVFRPGNETCIFSLSGKNVAVVVCEDLWESAVPRALKGKQVDLVLSLNASPYEYRKHAARVKEVKQTAILIDAPIIYVNMVGGQDSLVFDGGSFVLSQTGELLAQAKLWEPDFLVYELGTKSDEAIDHTDIEQIYQALLLGIRDYVRKNGFSKVCLGLSGGIDSALVATLAADALGAENVHGVRLPSRYSSNHSLTDAEALSENLGCKLDTISIEEVFKSVITHSLSGFKNESITEQNIQARIRGMVLMAFSNDLNELLLTTGNKSEYAVGYATIYGDMCGGFAPLKDVYKTRVYELSRWRNDNIPHGSHLNKLGVIPVNSINKPPSAELAQGDFDQDVLPAYQVLDAMLFSLIEEDKSIEETVRQGFIEDEVKEMAKRLKAYEYKRRQSAPGIKISSRSFDKERRYPITNKF